MRVLGLDPGLRHTGWGVIDVAGNRLSHVADGVVHAPVDLPLAERLVALFRQLTAVTDRIDSVATSATNAVQTAVYGLTSGLFMAEDAS